jgi:hypothetical protein
VSLTGDKHDEGKRPWHLLPYGPLCAVVDVLAFGASKYGAQNWKRVSGARERYFAAAQRHMVAWWLGEAEDEESNLSHLAHATCCLLFLLAFDAEKGPRTKGPCREEDHLQWLRMGLPQCPACGFMVGTL